MLLTKMSFSKITTRIRRLYETDKFTDVVFVVKRGNVKRKIRGHKVLFAASSKVFEAMLYGPLAGGDKILIEDIDPDSFFSLKEFIYTDKVQFASVQHAKNVYEVADKYDLPKLFYKAEQFLSANLFLENVLSILEYCKVYEKSTIEKRCLHIIRQQTVDVLKSNDFLNCDLNCISVILDDEELNIPEIELFNSLERWVSYHLETEGQLSDCEKQMLGNLIGKIKFLSMSSEEFFNGPGRSALLTFEEQQAILHNKFELGSVPLPEKFSLSTSGRKPLEHLPSLESSLEHDDNWEENLLATVNETVEQENSDENDDEETEERDVQPV